MLAALMVAVWAYAISQTLLIPSLPVIERRFSATPSGTSALMSAFLIAGAVTAGVFGRLGDMFGKRRVLLALMGLFSLGGLVCALAPSLITLIVGRVLMGSAVGLFPLAFSLVRDELPPGQTIRAVAILSGSTGTGAAVGQATGGLVSDHLGFRWIFWISVIGGCLSILALFLFVPRSSIRAGGRVDGTGAILLGLGLGATLVAISQAPVRGWTGALPLSLFGVGLVTLIAFVAYESRHPDPLIHLPTLTMRDVGLTNLTTLLVGFGLFSASTILTQFFQEPAGTGYGFAANPTQAGLFLVPGTALMLISAPTAGRLSTRFGPKTTLLVGAFIGAAALQALALWHTERWEMYLWPTLMYLGLGFAFGAMPTLILEAVPQDRSGESTAVNMTVRNIGSSIGIQIAAAIITASSLAGGIPSEHGYVLAFELLTLAALGAGVLAFAIPARRSPVEPRGRGETAPEQAAIASDRL